MADYETISLLLQQGRKAKLVEAVQAAVEEGGVHPEQAQHPDEASGVGAAGVVVGDDDRVVADAGLGHARGEGVRAGQRVASLLGRRRRGQPRRQVDEHRPRQVAGQVDLVAVAAVQVPAHVGDDGVRVLGEPVLADDGRELRE